MIPFPASRLSSSLRLTVSVQRYLRAKGEPGWLERDAENELGGFVWQHTQDPVTSGVLIWPEIFKVRLQLLEDKAANISSGLNQLEIIAGISSR